MVTHICPNHLQGSLPEQCTSLFNGKWDRNTLGVSCHLLYMQQEDPLSSLECCLFSLCIWRLHFPVITCIITKNSEQGKHALPENGISLVFTEWPPVQVIGPPLPHNLCFTWKFFRDSGHARDDTDVMRQSTLETQGNAFVSMLMTQAVALTWHNGLMLF